MKAQRKLPILHRQFKIGELKIPLQPLQKRRLKDAALSIERISGQPDQLRLVEAQPPRRLQLLAQLIHVDDVAQPHRARAIHQRERGLCRGKMLPDELQHQQLVEVRIEQATA